jgi:hypothetical protein
MSSHENPGPLSSAATASPRKIRYAVVGLGYIAQIAVLPAFVHAAENSELPALVSGDKKKLKSRARRYKGPKTYSYEHFADCLDSGEVDAVYIALPNNMHRAYAEGLAHHQRADRIAIERQTREHFRGEHRRATVAGSGDSQANGRQARAGPRHGPFEIAPHPHSQPS